MGLPQHTAKKPEKGLWSEYLEKYWQGGKKKVENPDWHSGDSEGRKEIEMITRVKKDPAFRRQVQQNFQAWKQQGHEAMEDRVSDFFESEGDRLPDDPTAVIQLMQYSGIVRPDDIRDRAEKLTQLVNDQLDFLADKEEQHDRSRSWWQRWMDLSASQKMAQRVASRWLRRHVAHRVKRHEFA